MAEWSYSTTNIYLGTRLRFVVSFTFRLIYCRRKSPPVPIEWTTVPLRTLWSAGTSAVQPVAIPTELSLLLNLIFFNVTPI
jgi:hypothetical protein